MTNNPYLPPSTDLSAPEVSQRAAEGSIGAIAKSVFIAWERLRIVYVVLLGTFTMMLAIPGVVDFGSRLFLFHGIIMIVEGAIIANICYFTGPVIETYVRWLGYDGKWVRWLLFASGTLLTAILALLSLSSGLIPV